MRREELERLSKAELIERILSQQVQIEKLQVALTELSAQLLETEARRSRRTRIAKDVQAREDIDEHATLEQQWEQATRDALRHLDNTVYLAQSSLAGLIAKHEGVWPEGTDLQQELLAALEDMEPSEDQPQQPRQQQRYDILHMAYLEKKRVVDTAQALAISERQYYRELKAAIQRVANYIQSQLS